MNIKTIFYHVVFSFMKIFKKKWEKKKKNG